MLTSIRRRPRRLYSIEGLAVALRSTRVQARLLDPCVPATLYAPDTPTAITNLFTGRPGAGHRLMADLGPLSDLAPAFPTAGALGALRSVAEAAGRDEFSPLWAGQSFPLAKPMSAAALIRMLAGASA